MTLCGNGCGNEVSPDTERLTRRGLAGLDKVRKRALAAMFEDREIPKVLCSACFDPILSSINTTAFEFLHGPSPL